MEARSCSAGSPSGTYRSWTTRAPNPFGTRPRLRRNLRAPLRPEHSHSMLHAVASNEIRFHPFLDQMRVHVKTVAHRCPAVEDLWRRGVGQEKSEIMGENFMDLTQPGTAIVLRHEVQLDQKEPCFAESCSRPGQDRLFVTLHVNFQK